MTTYSSPNPPTLVTWLWLMLVLLFQFLKYLFILLFSVYRYISCMYASALCACLMSSEVVSCYVGAGNRTQVLYQSNKCCWPPSQHSSLRSLFKRLFHLYLCVYVCVSIWHVCGGEFGGQLEGQTVVSYQMPNNTTPYESLGAISYKLLQGVTPFSRSGVSLGPDRTWIWPYTSTVSVHPPKFIAWLPFCSQDSVICSSVLEPGTQPFFYLCKMESVTCKMESPRAVQSLGSHCFIRYRLV